MNDRPKTDPPCVAALLTGNGRSAIATIAVVGQQASQLVDERFCPLGKLALADLPIHRIAFGDWSGSMPAAEGIVAVRFADRVELHCHGGSQAAQSILNDLAAAGVTVDRSPSDPHFVGITDRAGISIAGEAALALTTAATERAASILLDQFHGALEREIEAINACVAWGQLHPAKQRLRSLLDTWRLGKHLTKPWRVVLAGPPNVGKSSLINALVGYERAIVFDQPGTTRDVVSANTAIDGWPVQLSDTAGLRAAGCDIEAEGIARGRAEIARSDCVVIVVDHTCQPDLVPSLLVSLGLKRNDAIVVRNKIDLNSSRDPSSEKCDVFTSATTTAGLKSLLTAIAGKLAFSATPGAAVVFTIRQWESLLSLRNAIESKTGGPPRRC